MLKDIITYGGQTLLTVFHSNQELDVPGRCWREREKIGRFWLEFEESSGHDVEELPAESPFTERALLSHDHPLAPAGSHEFCALMTRHRTVEKPTRVFYRDGEEFCLEREAWERLCKFVERYIGLDLARAPMACGDTFVFHYVQLHYYGTKQGAIMVDPGDFDRVEIHFKRGKAVCEIQTRCFSRGGQGVTEFVAVEDGDSFDIYAYKKDELWFYSKDVVFMRELQINMNFGGNRAITLEKNSYRARFSNAGSHETLKIGETKENLRLEQERRENHLRAVCDTKEASVLIQKGGDHAVYRAANQLLDRHWDEVRLFDPYLLDKTGQATLVDWMRLLRGSPAERVCAIYYRKAKMDADLTIEDTKKLLARDWPLSQELRRAPNTLYLLGLNEYIHDRFLLCREKNHFKGIVLGTSLNSLSYNYFCIHSLSQAFAQECWETFDGVLRAHTVESEVL